MIHPVAYGPIASSIVGQLLGGAPANLSAYRYWALFNSIGTTNISFGEIAMRESAAGPDLTGGQPSFQSSSFNASFDSARGFDDDVETRWAASGWYKQFVGIDLGTAKAVAKLDVTAGNAFTNEVPTAFVVAGSDDGTTFVPVQLIETTPWGVREARNFDILPEADIDPSAPHRYWRFRILQRSGAFSAEITSFDLLDVNNTSLIDPNTGAASASGGANPQDAFDGNSNSWWNVANADGNATLLWDAGAGNALSPASYSLAVSGANEGPVGWAVQCSDDGTNWKTFDGRLNQADWLANEKRTFVVARTPDFDVSEINAYSAVQSEGTSVSELGGFAAAVPAGVQVSELNSYAAVRAQ